MRFSWRLLAICTIFLTGCAVKMVPTQDSPTAPNPTSARAHAFRGTIHGGQQPLYLANIYMFQVSTLGYGSPSISILQGGAGTNTTQDHSNNWYVTTDQNGIFNITSADYTCTPGQQVYLYSIGGSPGISNSANPGAGLMAVLGDCANFSQLPGTIQVNEVSTVAAAYALAGYALDATDIASSNTSAAATGVANAALNAANIDDLGTGNAQTTTASGGSAPQSEINTLADILAACINSTDSTYPNQNTGACGTLFSTATSDGTVNGTQPADTATAAINIAHNPGANVGTLYGLATSTAPFQPILSGSSGYTGPNDWTIAISYSGNGLSYTDGVAVDGNGNVWVSDMFLPTVNNGTLSKFSNTGTPLSSPSGFSGNGLYFPAGVAVDVSQNAWVADEGNNNLSAFTPSGGTFSTSPFIDNGLDDPINVAIDAFGNVWVTDSGSDNVSEFSSTGAGESQFGFNVGGPGGEYAGPTSIAVDGANNIWIGLSQNAIAEFPAAGGGPDYFTGGNLDNPVALAIDSNNNLWIANNSGNSLSEFDKNGNPITTMAAYSGGGLSRPNAVAVDGANNVWATIDSGGGGVAEFNNAGTALSPSTGFANTLGGSPNGIAIDSSGNIWLSGNVGGGLVELIGAASPIVTPLAQAVVNGQAATRP
jgi:sugar lactone lactonase YvrE